MMHAPTLPLRPAKMPSPSCTCERMSPLNSVITATFANTSSAWQRAATSRCKSVSVVSLISVVDVLPFRVDRVDPPAQVALYLQSLFNGLFNRFQKLHF